MANDFISILISCVAVLIMLTVLMAGIDIYFDLSDAIDFSSAFKMNIFFTLGSGFIMFLSFLLVLGNETLAMRIFHNLSYGFVAGLLLSSIIMYFVKYYLITKYEVVFNYPYLILLIETVSLMIVPYMFYRIINQLFKNLAHAH